MNFDFMTKHIKLEGFRGTADFFDLEEGLPSFQRNASKMLKYMQQGLLKLPVEKKFSLDDLETAFDYFAN